MSPARSRAEAYGAGQPLLAPTACRRIVRGYFAMRAVLVILIAMLLVVADHAPARAESRDLGLVATPAAALSGKTFSLRPGERIRFRVAESQTSAISSLFSSVPGAVSW